MITFSFAKICGFLEKSNICPSCVHGEEEEEEEDVCTQLQCDHSLEPSQILNLKQTDRH